MVNNTEDETKATESEDDGKKGGTETTPQKKDEFYKIDSPDYFYLGSSITEKGVEDMVSSASVGLYVDTPPPPPSATPRYNRIQIANRNDIVSLTNAYDDIKYTLTAYTFGTGHDFKNNNIYTFLSTSGRYLVTSRYSDYYYRINEITGIVPIAEYSGRRIKYNIEFSLEPFKYALDSEDTLDVTGTATVTNKGNVYSEPIFEIKLKVVENDPTKGDVNFDGVIDATDASLVLGEYAASLTDKKKQEEAEKEKGDSEGGGESESPVEVAEGESEGGSSSDGESEKTGGENQEETPKDGRLTEKQKKAADVNNDNIVDALDASLILEMYANKMSPDPTRELKYIHLIVNGATLVVGVPKEAYSNGFTVYVDSEKHLIYYPDTNGKMVSILHYSSYDLPLFHVGDNKVRCTSDDNIVEKVTIKINERWL